MASETAMIVRDVMTREVACVQAGASVEAAIAMSWWDILGDAGQAVSLEHFGASAPYEVLYEKFGITPEATVAAAKKSLKIVEGQ